MLLFCVGLLFRSWEGLLEGLKMEGRGDAGPMSSENAGDTGGTTSRNLETGEVVGDGREGAK